MKGKINVVLIGKMQNLHEMQKKRKKVLEMCEKGHDKMNKF